MAQTCVQTVQSVCNRGRGGPKRLVQVHAPHTATNMVKNPVKNHNERPNTVTQPVATPGRAGWAKARTSPSQPNPMDRWNSSMHQAVPTIGPPITESQISP